MRRIERDSPIKIQTPSKQLNTNLKEDSLFQSQFLPESIYKGVQTFNILEHSPKEIKMAKIEDVDKIKTMLQTNQKEHLKRKANN